MKAKTLGWKDIGLLVTAVVLNGGLLVQLVAGSIPSPMSVAFAQPYNDGQPCTSPGQCDSGFCTDGVCCNVECEEAGQSCTVPGRVGTCVSSAESPVMALPFQWVTAGLVALIAALRLRRRLR